MSGPIEVELSEDVLRVTLTRPEKKNALTGEMYEGLIATLDRARMDSIGALLLQGSGGVFTAGNDLGDFLAEGRAFEQGPALRFIRAIATTPTPIVAAVEGDAVGVGVTLLLHCDLVYAAPSARFRLPFVDLGLVPEAAASLLLPRRIGLARASELLLLGEELHARAAHRLGLLNGVVPASELGEMAFGQARRLARKPRQALRATRALLRGDPAEILARIDEEARLFAASLRTEAAQAALQAFVSRIRRPASAGPAD